LAEKPSQKVWKIAGGTIIGVLTLGFYIWVWGFDHWNQLRDVIFPVSIKVIVNSGAGQPFPLGLTISTDNAGKEYSKMSLVTFLLVNDSKRPHKGPFVFMIDHLPSSIYHLEVLTYTLPYLSLESCTGKGGGAFKPELFTGKEAFCVQFNPFIGRGTAEIFLLFEQKSKPTIPKDRIFFGPKDNPENTQLIEVVNLLAENRQYYHRYVFFLSLTVILTCVLVAFVVYRR